MAGLTKKAYNTYVARGQCLEANCDLNSYPSEIDIYICEIQIEALVTTLM